MDSLHTIGFYVSTAIALGGAVFVALLPGRETRSLALLVAGIGVAGVDASLSAGFAAAVVLVSFAGCAVLLGASRPSRSFTGSRARAWRQLVRSVRRSCSPALAYAAYRGDFAHVKFNGGDLGTAAVGRLLLARDALATEAIGVLVAGRPRRC